MSRWQRYKVSLYRNHVKTFPLWLMTVVYAAFGTTMICQPGRYENTPAYAILLRLLPAWIWGICYLVVAILLFTGLIFWRSNSYIVFVHTLSLILTTGWLLAFIVRYATDSGTTIVNVMSWSVFFILLMRSMLYLVNRAENSDAV